jgi:hypothetical protein
MTAGLDLDDPATAELRGQVILSKRFPCPEHAVTGFTAYASVRVFVVLTRSAVSRRAER